MKIFLGGHADIPSIKYQDKILTEDDDKADALNDYFGSVFVPKDLLYTMNNEVKNLKLKNCIFTPYTVFQALNKIKPCFSFYFHHISSKNYL